LNQKTYYNLLYKKPNNINNPNTIIILLKELNKTEFIYKIYTKNKINTNKKIVKYKLIQIIFFYKEVICFT